MTTEHSSMLSMMAERPGRGTGAREKENTVSAKSRNARVEAESADMGPLETDAYKNDWRAAYRYRRHLEKIAAERAQDLILQKLEKDAIAAAEQAMREAGRKNPKAAKSGFAGLREAAWRSDEDESYSVRALPDGKFPTPITAGRIAARLMFMRLFDSQPEVTKALKTSAPVIIVDIPDASMMDRIVGKWQDVLFGKKDALINAAVGLVDLKHHDATFLEVPEQPMAKDKPAAQKHALAALSLALPFVAISQLGNAHLPEAVVKASTYRMEMPRIDPATITRVIRVATGKPCRELLDARTAERIGIDDLDIAIRFDRTPSECLSELLRLAAKNEAKRKSRDLTLDQLHGMQEAVEWAKSTITDLADWKAGLITWDAIDNGVALTGPPGTGKSTFAKVFAADAGLPIVLGTLAKWQSSGEAHLGHLLRAMRQDFESARAQAPSVMFIDEIDSFPDRSGVQHSHRDYVVEVVNALLEQIDGIAGREGVIVIGASNDLTRCDPALLRAGRLNSIVNIRLPDVVELEKMLRVRLGNELRDEELSEISELAIGMTGADIEKTVKDAKRKARQEKRDMTLKDLRRALIAEDDRPPELKYRTCVHEAAHIVVDVIHNGPDHIFATAALVGSHAGASVRTHPIKQAGTYDEYHKMLEIILAGRVGEEMILGSVGHGAGGVAGSDLDRATTMAAAMAGSFGLAGTSPLMYLGAAKNSRDFMTFADIRESVRKELEAAAVSCRKHLEHHRGAVEAVADHLMEKGRIDGSEVARILGKREMVATQRDSQ